MTAWPRILRAAHERSISFVRIMPQSQATPRGKKRMTFTTASCRTNAFRKSTTSTSKRVMYRFAPTATARPHQMILYGEFHYFTRIMGKYAFGS